jgi:nitrogen fixation protein NifU and related proteins
MPNSLKERLEMPIYSEKVMDHFMHPRNVGEIVDADGVGEVGNPVCGDMMTFYIKVDGNRLKDVKFKTFGCGAAIAVSSMTSEMAIGKTMEEAMLITPQSVADELGGLPKVKFHCSNLGADALHLAIDDYRKKKGLAPLSAAEVHHHDEEDGAPSCDTPCKA